MHAVTPERSLLVVSPIEEDHGSLRSIFGQTGWRLYEATSLQEALACLRQQRIPVVLCEKDLRGCDWKGLLDAIRLLPSPPYLIVSSRHADHRLWAEVLNLGGYDLLSTPFEASEVSRVVCLAWLRWQRQWDREPEKPQPLRAAG